MKSQYFNQAIPGLQHLLLAQTHPNPNPFRKKATKFWLERSREDSFWLLKIGDENTSCKRHEVFNWYVAEETLFGILL